MVAFPASPHTKELSETVELAGTDDFGPECLLSEVTEVGSRLRNRKKSRRLNLLPIARHVLWLGEE